MVQVQHAMHEEVNFEQDLFWGSSRNGGAIRSRSTQPSSFGVPGKPLLFVQFSEAKGK